MSQEDYACCISADYHTLVDGKSGEEKTASLKEVRDWAASRGRLIDDISLTSIMTHIKSITDKFMNLV